jgi:hypothetical protein
MIFLAAYIFQPPEHIHSPLTAALWSPVLMPSRWLTSVVIFYFGAVVAMIATLAALGRPALALSGDHLTYFSPLPRQVRLDEVKAVRTVPGRRAVVLETTSKRIYISTGMLSPSADPATVAQALRSALHLSDEG